ncbi:AI-2E family transporter [Modicisalibacter xianhensis]|uniref:Predicted PurR-regulated permease PerM n=1 Tax=Modicisalibacter xianhensis TaxID=442341 RepID=A0A1I2ZPU6_9GAMM|nr:AI-2E family transporter [Halomonas xianhensis]SFH39867.1 Predicted PurR-regulated permease PerM [Halomonas xianhensis]
MDHDVDPDKRAIPFHLLLALAALVIIIAGMKLGADILVPLILSLFIAVICTAPVQWLQRLGLGRRMAVLVTLLILGVWVILLGSLLAGSIATFMEALPNLEEQLLAQYYALISWAPELGGYLQPHSITQWLDMSTLSQFMPAVLDSLGTLISQSLLITLLVGFMLFETLHFRDKVLLALEDPVPSLMRFNEFSANLKRYLAIKTLISLATGALIFLSCIVIGVGFPLLWGTLAFCLNYIPNIGSALAAIPAVLLTLVMPEGGPWDAFLLAIAYLVVNFAIGNLIEPRVMGHTLGLSTLVAFLSLVVWGWILGPVGMLLAVPLTMTLKIALNSHPETLWLAQLLGGSAEQRQAKPRFYIRKQ